MSETNINNLLDSFQMWNYGEFKLQENHNKHNRSFILIKILKIRQQSLLTVCFNPKETFNESRSSQLLDSTKEKATLPKHYSFSSMTMLWKAFTDDLDQNGENYKAETFLIEFLLKFIDRNEYSEIMKQKSYHQSFISFLEIAVSIYMEKQLSERVLRWSNCTEAITLMYNCLKNLRQKSFCTVQYDHLYEIVLSGMRSKVNDKHFDAINVLKMLIEYNSSDEIQSLLECKPFILTSLLAIIDYNIDIQHNKKEQLDDHNKKMASAVYALGIILDSHEQTMIRCLKEGAGYVIGRLVSSNNDNEAFEGVTLLRLIFHFSNNEIASFMLYDHYVCETQMWLKLASKQFIFHPELQFRKEYISMIFNFVTNFHLKQIDEMADRLTKEIKIPDSKNDVVDLLIDSFVRQDDHQIMQDSILSLKTILSYCEKEFQKNMSVEKKQNETIQYNRKSRTNFESISSRIARSQMYNKIKAIKCQPRKYKSKFYNICQVFLQNLDYQ